MPWGTSAAGNSNSNSNQFTGRENDGTLYYYRARYYSPTLQRFISQDPIGFAGGDSNLYAYAGNSPLALIDPSGLTDISINITRDTFTNASTGGQISISSPGIGAFSAYSLEPPAGHGAIPTGSYPAHWRTDSGPGLNHHAVELDPLPNGQTNVQIHPGNTALDTTACILPGTSRNTDRVNHSRDATQSINNIITQTLAHDLTTGEPTTINVNVQNAVQSGQPVSVPPH
jgi:RHS repeat-associated protein